jgi:hypothetical protein
MKARKLIEGATYGPETLKVIGKAFDEAWSEISGHFTRNGLQAQSARLKLAHALLAVAREDSRDTDELKNAALQIMAMNYKDQSDPSSPVGRQPAVVTNLANTLK